MSEPLRHDETGNIRIFAWNGNAPVTGLGTIDITIEDIDDGKFWNGSSFQVIEITVEAVELTVHTHHAGVYFYNFNPPDVDRTCDWSWDGTAYGCGWVRGRIIFKKHLLKETTSDFITDGTVGEALDKLLKFYNGAATFGHVDDVSPTTNSFITDLIEATSDHYNLLVIVFYEGVLKGQARKVTNYVGGSKTIECIDFIEAPGNGDGFLILGLISS